MAKAASGPGNLLDQIKAEQTYHTNHCTGGDLMAKLSSEDQQAVYDAHEQGVQTTAIMRWIGKRLNVKVNKTFARHLNKECKCRP